MKKLAAYIALLSLILSLSTTANAASPPQLGTDNFDEKMTTKRVLVNKTVKVPKGYVKVQGYYHVNDSFELVSLVNKEREKVGLHALKWDNTLADRAMLRALSQYLSKKTTKPSSGKVTYANGLLTGENVASVYTAAEDVVVEWTYSLDQEGNMLRPEYIKTAVCCVETDAMVYWVQLFQSDPEEFKKYGYDPDEVARFKGGEINKITKRNINGKPAAAITAAEITAKLDAAKTTNETTAITLTDAENIAADAITAAKNWAAANGKTVNIIAKTTTNSKTTGQLKINPKKIVKLQEKGINTLVRTSGSSLTSTQELLSKKYKGTKAQVISLSHSGVFGGYVSVFAKADASTGIDTTKPLYACKYDAASKKMIPVPLDSSGITVDKSGFINFTTSFGGNIIITNQKLA